jgi:rhodanese-related sulfurtransferase
MGLFRRTTLAQVDATTARAMLDDGAVLLDVREDDEWTAGHAPDAVHVPLGALPARRAEVPTDRPVVVACRSGRLSALAARQLVAGGVDAHNLSGGMAAWARAGLPVVDRRGRAGTVV